MSKRTYGTLIIGAGPAGIAVLLAACRAGRLEDLLGRGLAIVEATDCFGAGQIGNYAINSDSTAATFIDCLHNNPYPELASLQDHALVRDFAAQDQNAISLHLVGQLSVLIGEALKTIITRHSACAIYVRSKVILACEEHAGTWRSLVSLPNGETIDLISTNLVLATGAQQPKSRLATEFVGGKLLHTQCNNRLIQSGDVLRDGGIEQISRRLAGTPHPKLAVLGGSTSAVSVAHSLLNRLRPQLAHANAVRLLHRHKLRIYYPSVADALADGYRDFTQGDLCPLTNRVFRFAGLRLDSKEVICRALGIGGRQPDPRLQLHHVQSQDPKALQIIAESDLVIACFGYRPIGLKLIDRWGQLINLNATMSVRAPLVDENCRVLDENQRPLHNIFGIGLAAGFTPRGALGGEPSFTGQANGLWLWQTAVGAIIIDKILNPGAGSLIFAPGITTRSPARVPRPSTFISANANAIQDLSDLAGSGT